MAHLMLSLLGPYRTTLDGEPATGFRANKVRALLAYLAVEAHPTPRGRQRPHPRRALAGLLWPDQPERAALASLRNALATLRTAIGDRHATPPFLQITREAIQFDVSSDHWLDVAAFRTLIEAAEADPSANPRLEEAVALHRGDFLAGFSVRGSPDFEDWALLTRERLQRQALDALRRLVAHYQDQGEVGRACEMARRQVELAPWEEESHRRLIRLLALNGQRSAALAQYEACRRVLGEDLGVAPGAETTALYERIRDGTLGQEAAPIEVRSGRGAQPPALPPFLSAAPLPHSVRTPFVARERELARLDESLERTLAGDGRIAFVTGEAGTGKTALVREYARRAQARHTDLIVAGGDCNAYTGAGDPYLPFREVLGQLTGDVESSWAAGAIGTDGARRLWLLIPLAIQSLLETSPGLIHTFLAAPPLAARAAAAAPGGADWRGQLEAHLATAGSSLRRADLHVQFTALLAALARRHPLLLILDDLHWADAGSIDLLFHLGRRLPGSCILIVGIYRPTEVSLGRDGDRHPLAPLIHEFQRQYGPIDVDLPQAGDRRFVEAFLDSEPNGLDQRFRERLYQHTGGHALCTVEMLRDMQERGDIVRDETGRWVEGPAVSWGSLPAQFEGVIGERVDRLPEALRDTLRVASVEGASFTAEVVAQVQGASAYQVVGQLSRELDRRHQLVVSEGSLGTVPGGRRASRYRFRHILFQQYAYGRLDPAEKAYLHEAVGNALEQVQQGQTEAIAVQLARHYHAAGRMDKAADYYLQAGDRARGLYAHAEARRHYAQALDALARLPDTVETRQRRVDALIAQTASSGADSWERNLARLAEAKRVAQTLPGHDGRPGGDRLRVARVHLGMGRAHYTRGAYRECLGYYQQALSVARERGDGRLIARSSSAMGQALASRGRFGQAEALFSQVIDLHDKAGDRGGWARALSLHGSVVAYLGDYAVGVAELQRGYEQLRELNALSEMTFNKALLSITYRAGGEASRATQAARRSLALAEQTGVQVSIYDGYLTLGWAVCRAGQYDAAAAYAAKATAILQELGGRLVMADQLAALDAEIACGAGRVREAIILAEQAVGIAQERKTIHCEGLARRTWGQALAALVHPQWDEAEAQLAESLRLLEAGQSQLEAARTQVAWGTLCRDRGDLAAARAHWERAAAQWEASGLTHELERTRELSARATPE
jgi:DNA-binding SARP family transcriptional activator